MASAARVLCVALLPGYLRHGYSRPSCTGRFRYQIPRANEPASVESALVAIANLVAHSDQPAMARNASL